MPKLTAGRGSSDRQSIEVCCRGREEFENGRDYYALEGSSVRLPLRPAPPPSAEYLEWLGATVFRR